MNSLENHPDVKQLLESYTFSEQENHEQNFIYKQAVNDTLDLLNDSGLILTFVRRNRTVVKAAQLRSNFHVRCFRTSQ